MNTGLSAYGVTPPGSMKTTNVKTNWKSSTGNLIFSCPAIGSDGKIYVGSLDQSLYCFYPDGSTNWHQSAGGSITGSSSVIDNNGNIYIGTWNNYIDCFNPDGSIKWQTATLGQINSSPAITSDGRIYIGSYDNYLYCLNSIDGSIIWKRITGDVIISSPGIGNDSKIYIGCRDSYLYCFNPDGTTNWKAATGNILSSVSAIGLDGKIYIGSEDNYLYSFNTNGTTNWKAATGNFIESSPTIGSDGKIYVGSRDNYLYCFNTNGTTNWKAATGNIINIASPVLGNGGKIYIGSMDANLYCFSVYVLFTTPHFINITPMSINQINLIWSYISNNTSYTLYRNTANNTNGAINIGSTPYNITNYNDTGLKAGTTYYYWLKANYYSGSSGFSSVISNSTFALPPSGNLDNVIIGPNPFKPTAQNNVITFYNLTSDAEIKIYSITGILITDLKKNNATDTFIWDGKNSHGKSLPTGIYICYITNSQGQTQHLQLVIQR